MTTSLDTTQIREWANWAGKQLNVPGEYIFAQWKMETGGFDSNLALNNTNLSGIKDTSGNYRKFNSLEDFAQGYVKFLSTNRYIDARNQTDFWSWIRGLGYRDNKTKGGYYGTEAPESYGNKVLSVLKGVSTNSDLPEATTDTTGATTSTNGALNALNNLENGTGILDTGRKIALMVLLAALGLVFVYIGLQSTVGAPGIPLPPVAEVARDLTKGDE